jgi:hypothetical protein
VIQENGFAHATEILQRVREAGLTFTEVPITLTLPGLKTGDSFLLQPGMLVAQSYSPSTGVLRLQVSLGDGCCLYCEHSAQLGFRKTERRGCHGGNGRASSPSPYIPVLNDGALRRHLVTYSEYSQVKGQKISGSLSILFDLIVAKLTK